MSKEHDGKTFSEAEKRRQALHAVPTAEPATEEKPKPQRPTPTLRSLADRDPNDVIARLERELTDTKLRLDDALQAAQQWAQYALELEPLAGVEPTAAPVTTEVPEPPQAG